MENKRVRLIRMEDPYTKLKSGDMGTIMGKDSLGQILVKWDNGESLHLIPEIDEYDIVEEKVVKFYEFVTNVNSGYLKSKIEELKDLVSGFSDVKFSCEMGSEIEGGKEESEVEIEIEIPHEGVKIEWTIDLNEKTLQEETTHREEEDEYFTKFSSIEEAFEIIEKEIYYWLGVPEKKINK